MSIIPREYYIFFIFLERKQSLFHGYYGNIVLAVNHDFPYFPHFPQYITTLFTYPESNFVPDSLLSHDPEDLYVAVNPPLVKLNPVVYCYHFHEREK